MRYGEHLMSSDNHLPVSLSQETWDHGLAFVDISHTHWSVERLGQEIVINNEAGLAASKEARHRLVDAGHLLIEAKSRVANFEEFLRVHCNELSRSWAHDLILIASGKMDEVRAKAKARKLKYRQKRATEEATVRSGTDMRFPPIPLSQKASLDHFESEFAAWLGKLDAETFKRALSCVLRLDNDRNPALDLTASAAQ
jgi:hypothetical protein